jgi:hypothetical protein
VLRRLAGLLYLLASTYLVARLITNFLLSGAWGLTLELVVLAVAVALVQAVLLELLQPLRRALKAPAPQRETATEQRDPCGS